MKITISREEMVKIISDHFPIPPGFRIDEVRFDKYEDDVIVAISQIQPCLPMDRPLFQPQRFERGPCVVDDDIGAPRVGDVCPGEDI